MLDYDSMRSKVKKLTEKPDKDPSKLPRTEKEADMVGDAPFILQDFLPSPPKVLDGIRRMDAEEDALVYTSSFYRNDSCASSMVGKALTDSEDYPEMKHNSSTTPSICITPARPLKSTPFFHPSELEDIMAPIRKEFVIQQTDMCAQAKAAYEQLNQQLTDELPQLIDLR